MDTYMVDKYGPKSHDMIRKTKSSLTGRIHVIGHMTRADDDNKKYYKEEVR